MKVPPKINNDQRNRNQPTPPAHADPLNKKVTHVEFWVAFQVLAQAMTIQVN